MRQAPPVDGTKMERLKSWQILKLYLLTAEFSS